MRFSHLLRASSGVAMTEFAISLPFLLVAGMWGVETANYAITTMRINQIAVHLADNASRVGDTSNLMNRKIYEADINDLLRGAAIQAGGLDFLEHGRAIVSSLEVLPDTEDTQYIHWQRCKGKKAYNSSYGVQDEGKDGSLAGMGPEGEEVTALPDTAVIFVEVAYDYQPIISTDFIRRPEIRSISSFMVRDPRDLSQVYQIDAANPDPVSDCGTFDTFPPA